MKYIAFILLVMTTACSKNNDRLVSYIITDSVSGFDVRYLNESGEMIHDKITVQSAEDSWNYDFTAKDGDIVFVSANYKDPLSSIKVMIMIDGKAYKQAVTRQDTISFVTVSGVIPIRE